MALFRHHVDAVATAFSWTRTVDTEQQQWVGRRSEWKPAEEARNVQRHQESHWETVTEWQPGPPGAGGLPGIQQPQARQELRTRTFYTYEALKAAGADRNDVHWPPYSLAPGERLRGKSETYSATFTLPDKQVPDKQYEAALDEAQWRALTLGATYRLTLGLLGGVHEVAPI
jgi:hypothetical protein